EYNSASVLIAAREYISKEEKILRIRSDRAGETLSNQLRETFEQVEDVVICRNQFVTSKPPVCDGILFASVSAVESFVEQFGPEALQGKELTVIGKMDEDELRRHGVENITSSEKSTIEGAVEAMSRRSVQKEMLN
ncbi:MAG: uroporphyrinogen-III synthase, partial [Kiritimatiellaceae bacterium]|nr:uroporphyrinogen-III synthase [Kiritimatiellaceae bacterium]